MPIDPVCGVQLDEDEAVTAKYHGQTYYFCCDDCKEEFAEAPEEWVGDEVANVDEDY
jgi:YHS domain-containing protein